MTVDDGPVQPDSQTLVVHLKGLLEVIQRTFTEEDVLLPQKQYITVGGEGTTAWDCEQLTLSLAQVYSGPPGDQAQLPARCGDPSSAVVIVELVRCIPVPAVNTRTKTGVSEEKMTAAGIGFMVDAWLLKRASERFGDEQSFFGSMADVTFSAPQSGYQAVVMTVVAGVV